MLYSHIFSTVSAIRIDGNTASVITNNCMAQAVVAIRYTGVIDANTYGNYFGPLGPEFNTMATFVTGSLISSIVTLTTDPKCKK